MTHSNFRIVYVNKATGFKRGHDIPYAKRDRRAVAREMKRALGMR